MNYVDVLIEKLCPEGVPTRSLGDLEDSGAIKLGRGNVISRIDLQQDPGDYPVYSSSAVGAGEFGRYGKFMFEDERITWSVDGGGKFFYRPSHRYSVTNVCGWISVREPSIIQTKFLYYSLINAWSKKIYNYTVKAHPSVIRVDYVLSIPPLEVQQEIVRILDTFTELEAELEAELDARKKQYEHYRNILLTFPEQGVRWVPMGELLRIRNGKDHKHLGEGNVPVWGSGGIMRYADQSFYSEPSVLIPRKGSLGNLFFTDEPFWTVDTLFYTEIDQSLVIPKFIYRFLQTQDLAAMNEAGGVPSLTQTMLNKIQIPVPEISIQKELVAKIDTLDELISGATASLPAEIAARRAQYEYYRDKLLTFKEVAA